MEEHFFKNSKKMFLPFWRLFIMKENCCHRFFFTEIMRMYPTPRIDRTCTADYAIPGTNQPYLQELLLQFQSTQFITTRNFIRIHPDLTRSVGPKKQRRREALFHF